MLRDCRHIPSKYRTWLEKHALSPACTMVRLNKFTANPPQNLSWRSNAMKFMSTWTVLPGTLKEAVGRFLDGQGQPPDGVTILGRWHKTDCSGGFVLNESSNPGALFESAARWADVLEIHVTPVIEDGEVGPVFAKVFKK
jgi:hypothetical protein